MKVDSSRLFPADDVFYYLYGEDGDALSEAAGRLLGEGNNARLLRIDINELECAGNEIRHDNLFGPNRCHVLVRNAEQANPKQAEQLIKLASQAMHGVRIIVCAANVDTRKAWHKQLLTVASIKHCRFPILTPEAFQAWLLTIIREAGLRLTDEARALLSEQLQGKRQAARQTIQRLSLYAGESGELLDTRVVGILLGERLSEGIGIYCRHVARRSPGALSTLHCLLYDQLISEVQILAWLQPRFTQLLLYKWYASKDSGTALKKARVFYANRGDILTEARLWSARDLMLALNMIADTEKQLKGASIESKPVVLEHLTRDILNLAG